MRTRHAYMSCDTFALSAIVMTKVSCRHKQWAIQLDSACDSIRIYTLYDVNVYMVYMPYLVDYLIAMCVVS